MGQVSLARQVGGGHILAVPCTARRRWRFSRQNICDMRRVDIQPQLHIQRRLDRLRRARLPGRRGDFDNSAHAPVVHAAPARAVEGVFARLVKCQRDLRDLAGAHFHRRLVRLADGKAVRHVIRGQAQVQGLACRHRQVFGRPAASFRHPCVDHGLLRALPPAHRRDAGGGCQ